MSPEEAGCFVAERREAGECGVPNCKKFHGERRLEEDALAAAVLQDESTRWWMRTRAGDGGKARKALMLTTHRKSYYLISVQFWKKSLHCCTCRRKTGNLNKIPTS
jgi:hypothetical protein